MMTPDLNEDSNSNSNPAPPLPTTSGLRPSTSHASAASVNHLKRKTIDNDDGDTKLGTRAASSAALSSACSDASSAAKCSSGEAVRSKNKEKTANTQVKKLMTNSSAVAQLPPPPPPPPPPSQAVECAGGPMTREKQKQTLKASAAASSNVGAFATAKTRAQKVLLKNLVHFSVLKKSSRYVSLES